MGSVRQLWQPVGPGTQAMALYSFNPVEQEGGNVQQALHLVVGQIVDIYEECGGWYRGAITHRKPKVRGLFPKNYVQLRKTQLGVPAPLPGATKAVVSEGPIGGPEDPFVEEAREVLREWVNSLSKLLEVQNYSQYETLRNHVMELLKLSRQLVAQNLSEDGLRQLRKQIAAQIDSGNRAQGLDIVPRLETGAVMDLDNATLIDLYKTHKEMSQKAEAERSGSKTSLSHMYFDLKACIASLCHKDETAELFFSIYNKQTKSQVSEDYCVVLTHNGMPKNEEKIGKLRTLFIDLSPQNLMQDIYLTCRIIRVGKMNTSDQGKAAINFRRPFGAAVLDIVDILQGKTNPDSEYNMPIFVSQSEETFYSLLDNIMNNAGGYQTVPTAQALCVSMRMFHGDTTQVIAENPTLLKDIQKTEKFGFPDVILPNVFRNVLYLSLLSGEFEKGRKTTGKNIEISITVRDQLGNSLPTAISRAAGEPNRDEFESVVIYHSNSPRLNETIRLDVPIDQYAKCHLFIQVRHCSTKDSKDKADKTFAFGFAQLVQLDGTVFADGEHQINLYKFDTKLVRNTSSYLHDLDKLTPLKDALVIKTMLCSTKLTQNISLLSLLRWKNSSSEKMSSILKNFTFIGDVEIAKFSQDIFDALFAILDSEKNINNSLDDLVFSALVFIVGIITDKRFTHFRPVLDNYVEMHFSGAMAHKHLIGCLKKLVSNPSKEDLQQTARSAMKALEYIFKFIIQSRILQRNQERNPQNAAKAEQLFKQDFNSLCEAVNAMMILDDKVVIGVQTLALLNFPSAFNELSKLYPPRELADLAIKFIQKVNLNPKLQSSKLQMLQILIKTVVFEQQESRTMLTPHIMEVLQAQFSDDNDNLTPGIGILTEVLHILLSSPAKEEEVISVGILLPRLIDAYNAVFTKNVATGRDLVALILSIFMLMTPEIFEKYVQVYKRNNGLQLFIKQVIETMLSFLKGVAFPHQWSSMRIVQCKVILKIIQLLNPVMNREVNVVTHEEIWTYYLSLIITFLNNKSLQLETFSSWKQNNIKRTYGDLRTEASLILKSLWASLGGVKTKVILELVGPLLELTMSLNIHLRTSALDIFYGMLETEYQQRKTLSGLETECIDKIDKYVNEGKGHVDYPQIFRSHLQEKLNYNPSMKEAGAVFLKKMDTLMELLFDLRAIPESDFYDDERAQVILNLMNFVKGIDRHDAYVRYVHQLANLQLKCKNPTEAGQTYLLHIGLLRWDPRMLPAEANLPAQPSNERREALYQKTINLFDEGKNWEDAIQCCKELSEYYETIAHDYVKWGQLLQRESSFVMKIATQDRYFPEYFRVGFYGFGFPASLRNKQFIYRGEELERISAFCERIQDKYPDAELLKTNAAPGSDITSSNGKFIQIVKVNPEPDPSRPELRSIIPQYARAYYESNDICNFSFSRPFKKQKTGNEFMDLWIEKTMLKTPNKMPSMLRRLEVVESSVVELSPIENAVINMTNKNKELLTLETKHRKERGLNVNPFTMCLNGVADAPVNGGVNQYKDNFFSDDYIRKNPQHREFIETLRGSIDDQVIIMDRLIDLHSQIVPEAVLPLHHVINQNFEKNFASEIARLLPDRKKRQQQQQQQMHQPQASQATISSGGIGGDSSDDLVSSTSASSLFTGTRRPSVHSAMYASSPIPLTSPPASLPSPSIPSPSSSGSFSPVVNSAFTAPLPRPIAATNTPPPLQSPPPNMPPPPVTAQVSYSNLPSVPPRLPATDPPGPVPAARKPSFGQLPTAAPPPVGAPPPGAPPGIGRPLPILGNPPASGPPPLAGPPPAAKPTMPTPFKPNTTPFGNFRK